MKAIQVQTFGEPETLQLVELVVPEPAAAEVLIKVEAIGVNPVDTYIRAGTYPVLPSLPYTPGKDVSGIVVKVGEGVKKWQEGDRVYSAGTVSGGYAEFTLCHQSLIFALPPNIDFKQGASIGVPGAAAWRALFIRGRAGKGDKLLVHGASGSVGLIAIQIAVSAGLEVHGTAGTEEGLEKIEKAGASRVFNHRAAGYLEEIKTGCADNGYDIILEMLANINLVNDLSLLGVGGRVVIIGSRGEITIDPRSTMAKETEILGMSLFNSSDNEMKAAHVGLYHEMITGRLLPEIALELPLKDAPEAHRRVLQSGNCGKILLIPGK